MSAALRRGFFHILCGLVILVVAILFPMTPVLVGLGAFTLAFLAVELIRLKVSWLNKLFCRWLGLLLRDSESSRVSGASYFLVASLLALLFFRKDTALLAIAFLTIGDPLATLVRNQREKKNFSRKAVAGAVTCFAACLVAGWLFYSNGSSVSLYTILLGAAVASITEAVPIPVDDNLTVPLLAGLAMTIVPF
ncbi:MAG: hypothetical protein HY670_04760 [Chloroflexi bacterium]|nr:hypothetical protein [Chloroflexota bacterium]